MCSPRCASGLTRLLCGRPVTCDRLSRNRPQFPPCPTARRETNLGYSPLSKGPTVELRRVLWFAVVNRSVARRCTNPTVVLIRANAELATWPLPTRHRTDLSVVDELARLQLTAVRLGCSIRLRDASSQMAGLLELVGLGDIVATVAHPTLDTHRQAEGREQVGIEKAVEPRDPPA